MADQGAVTGVQERVLGTAFVVGQGLFMGPVFEYRNECAVVDSLNMLESNTDTLGPTVALEIGRFWLAISNWGCAS